MAGILKLVKNQNSNKNYKRQDLRRIIAKKYYNNKTYQMIEIHFLKNYLALNPIRYTT